MTTPSVLFESSGVLALIKPAGLPTQAPAGIDSVEAWARRRAPAGSYLGVPHRLDRAVSGILLLAVTPRAARKLSRQFERREIRKTYLAIVADEAGAVDGLEAARLDGARLADTAPHEAAGVTWRDFIEKIPDEPQARLAEPGSPAAREAVTRVRLLGRLPRYAGSVLELEPLTGRMHQLRLQSASRGMPVLGDTRYGAPAADWFRPPAGDDVDPRTQPIALHAWRISYADPDTGQRRTAEAPLPAGWPEAAVSLVAGRQPWADDPPPGAD